VALIDFGTDKEAKLPGKKGPKQVHYIVT